jgi:hypothetical protein
MTGSLPRYQASGRVSPRLLPSFAGAVAAAVGLGWAYQAFTGSGYVFLNIVVYALFVVGVLALVVAAGRLGHVRSRGLAAITGLAIGGAALAAAYVFDWRALADRLGEEGLAFGDFLDRRVAIGWTFGARAAGEAGTLTGGWVWLVWIVEALGVLGPAVVFAAGFGPYCERCGRWMEATRLRRTGGLDVAAAAAVARATTVDELVRPLAPAVPPGPFTLDYTAHRCAGCAVDAYLTITQAQALPRPPPRARERPVIRRATLHMQVAVPDERLRALSPSPAPAARDR